MLKKKIKILIVGGTGFIGYHLCKACLKRNWSVTSISIKKPKKTRALKKIKYILCDISKINEIKKKINSEYDFVVNLGGYVDHKNKDKTYKSHYIGCRNLVNYFLKKNIQLFVQIGSSSENSGLRSPQTESLKGKPVNHYGKAKLMASKYLFKKKNKELKFIIFRLYQVYGPHQDRNRFLPQLISACLKRKIFDCSDGNQFRDFLFIEDLIAAFFKAFEAKINKGRIINVGSGKSMKLKKIILKIVKLFKAKTPNYGKIKLRKDEQKVIYPNIINAYKILKWKPKTTFNQGLNKTIKFYKLENNK
ncbi:MAG: NAD(P)-dependent oxidoreductase [Pelagibacteraceae bacterium]|nr:NAD(P)-dependent oxidoreductase [Pelagibacteraceae bacterium]